jgi:hypothetical protein
MYISDSAAFRIAMLPCMLILSENKKKKKLPPERIQKSE